MTLRFAQSLTNSQKQHVNVLGQANGACKVKGTSTEADVIPIREHLDVGCQGAGRCRGTAATWAELRRPGD